MLFRQDARVMPTPKHSHQSYKFRLQIVPLRENFWRSTPKFRPICVFAQPLQCVCVPPSSHWFSLLVFPALTNSSKGLYLIKIMQGPLDLEGWYQELAGSQQNICFWWLICIQRLSYVIVCLWKLDKNDKWMVNISAQCSSYIGDLIRILICLFAFFSPFLPVYSHRQPKLSTQTYRNKIVSVSGKSNSQ